MSFRAAQKRLAALEAAQREPGRVVFVDANYDDPGRPDLPPEEFEARLAAAHAEAGPHGTVVVIRYTDGPVHDEGDDDAEYQ